MAHMKSKICLDSAKKAERFRTCWSFLCLFDCLLRRALFDVYVPSVTVIVTRVPKQFRLGYLQMTKSHLPLAEHY